MDFEEDWQSLKDHALTLPADKPVCGFLWFGLLVKRYGRLEEPTYLEGYARHPMQVDDAQEMRLCIKVAPKVNIDDIEHAALWTQREGGTRVWISSGSMYIPRKISVGDTLDFKLTITDPAGDGRIFSFRDFLRHTGIL